MPHAIFSRGRSRQRRLAPIAIGVRSGACVAHKNKDFVAVINERFGDPPGFVGNTAQRVRA